MRKVTFKVGSPRDGNTLTQRLMDQRFSVDRIPTSPGVEMIYGYGDPDVQSEESAVEISAGLDVQTISDETTA